MRNEQANPIRKNIILALLCAAALIVIAAVTLFSPGRGVAPGNDDAQMAGSAEELRVAEGCELLQTLTYTRCEHVVTRRVTAPAELHGKTLKQVEPLYEAWRITEFSPKLIKMEQKPNIHCPDHMVLMPNGAGVLCVFENKYGDALALVSELTLELSALPAEIREDVQQGLGFSTLAELEQWLESVES